MTQKILILHKIQLQAEDSSHDALPDDKSQKDFYNSDSLFLS